LGRENILPNIKEALDRAKEIHDIPVQSVQS
jgi:hypothetical protein